MRTAIGAAIIESGKILLVRKNEAPRRGRVAGYRIKSNMDTSQRKTRTRGGGDL